VQERSRKILTAAVAAATAATIAASVLWSLYRVRMSAAEELSARAEAFLISHRHLYAVPSDEALAAVLPESPAALDAGALYVGALVGEDGAPKELPPRPEAAVPGLLSEAGKLLEALEHPSIGAILRGAAMRGCDLTGGGLALSDDLRSSASLPLDGCRRAADIVLGAASVLEGRGERERAEELRRLAAGFGRHLTRDVRAAHFSAGSDVLARAAKALRKAHEAGGDAERAALAARVERAASGWSAHGETVILALRRLGVTAEGAERLAAEIERLKIPAMRAEGIYSLGAGWCYNLYERKRGPVSIRAEALEALSGSGEAAGDEAAVLAMALGALSAADVESLLGRVEEAVR